jgi:hypothetical protein
MWTMELLLVAISFALASVWYRSAQRAKNSVAEIEKERIGVEEDIRAALERIAAAAKSKDDLKGALKEAQTRLTAESLDRNGARQPNLAVLLENNPKLRDLYRRSLRSQLALKYVPLYHKLGLLPAQTEKFEDLITERDEEKMDLQATAQSQSMVESDPAITSIQERQDADLSKAEIGLLGDTGYQQLQQFDRMQPLEDFVDRYVADFIPPTSTPLTEGQREQLLNVFANAVNPSRSPEPGDVIAWAAAIDWNTALPQAGNFLSPSQLATLQINAQQAQVGGLLKQFFQLQAATK